VVEGSAGAEDLRKNRELALLRSSPLEECMVMIQESSDNLAAKAERRLKAPETSFEQEIENFSIILLDVALF
jgi:hypothetical protein